MKRKRLVHCRVLSRGICIIALMLAIMTFGCSGDDSDSENNGSDIEPITDSWSAEDAVRDVADVILNEVLDGLSQGTHTDQTVSGISGTASVTGEKYYSGTVSCGSSCVESYNDTTVTVVFSNFKAQSSDNSETTLNGTVTYGDNTWSRQSGSGYTSGGQISVSGSNVDYYWEAWSDYATWGTDDTISFSGSGSSIHGSFSGWCTASNDETYNF